MKQFLIIVLILIYNSSLGQVHVKGYYRSNGTYVQPHVRTSPNSTITDNYSYPGNYNPNTNSITPTPTFNSTNNSSTNSSSNSGKVWVNGYYRQDGTYVNGYYRNSPNSGSSTNTNNQNTSTTIYKYVNTKKVNVRIYPSSTSDICTTLDWNQAVKTLNTIDNWARIEFSIFNTYTNTFESKYGYINSSLLNDSYNNVYTTDESSENNTSNHNSIAASPYKYINTRKVNVRMYPSATSEILTTMDCNQTVKTFHTYNNWTLIEFSLFDIYTNAYETKLGYINASLLSTTYNSSCSEKMISTQLKEIKVSNRYVVKNYQAFFHTKPNTKYIRKAYLIYGDKVTFTKESKYFVYVFFTNSLGQTSNGWIRKDDLELD